MRNLRLVAFVVLLVCALALPVLFALFGGTEIARYAKIAGFLVFLVSFLLVIVRFVANLVDWFRMRGSR